MPVAGVGEVSQLGQGGVVAAGGEELGEPGLGVPVAGVDEVSQLGQGGVVAAGGEKIGKSPDWACGSPVSARVRSSVRAVSSPRVASSWASERRACRLPALTRLRSSDRAVSSPRVASTSTSRFRTSRSRARRCRACRLPA